MPPFDMRHEYYDPKTKKVVHAAYKKFLDADKGESFERGKWLWNADGKAVTMKDGSPIKGVKPLQVSDIPGLIDQQNKDAMFKISRKIEPIVENVEDLANLTEADLLAGTQFDPALKQVVEEVVDESDEEVAPAVTTKKKVTI